MTKIKKELGVSKSLRVRATRALYDLLDPSQKDIKKRNWPNESLDEEAWRIDSFLRQQFERNCDKRKFARYEHTAGNLRNSKMI